MTKTNSKKALLSSAFALVLSVAMLIGTTFAWFTDTASTAVNKIVSGNLKVDIIGENSDSHIENLNFKKTAATDAEAGAAILWEPGCRYLTEGFRIANKGNLALKWKAQVNMNNIINGKVEGSTIAKDGKSLLDVIDFYVVTKAANGTETEVAIENFVGNLKKTETSEVYYIKGVMQTTAGNDYQDLTLDGITVTVIAAQDTVENDSFDNQYDKDAKYPIVAMDALQELINNAAEPVSVKLEGNIAFQLHRHRFSGVINQLLESIHGNNRILRILIILIIKAVVFDGILSSNNSDGDAVQRQILIVIAGSGLHYALDVIYFAGFGLFQIADKVFNRDLCFCSVGCLCYNIEIDNIQQALAVLGNSRSLYLAIDDVVHVDLCFPLQSQIAFVGNSKALGQIAAARLPENRCAGFRISCSSLFEVQIFNMRITVLPDNIHFKIAGYNLVDRSRCGVGEPRKGGADEHCNT